MVEIISPDWVQAGELGFAFIVLILSAGLVRFVLHTSGKREATLLKIVQEITPALSVIIDALEDIDDRLDKVEQAVGVDGSKRKSRGLKLNDS